jgi:hypothetical protein
MVELYRQRKTPDLSTRALWQSCQKLSSSKAGEEGNDEFGLTYRNILRHWADSFTSPPKEGVLQILRPRPAKLGSNGKHAKNYTTKDDVTVSNIQI